MNVVDALTSINTFDLLVLFALFALFILGYIQGAIRRLLGIAALLFSFLLAGQLRDPIGAFLARNWTQLPAQYNYMLAYGIVFVVLGVAFSVVIQGFYKRQPLFEKYTVADELLGGILGVVEGVILLAAAIVVLDSYFRIPGIPVDSDEVKLLRDLFNAYTGSETAHVFRETIVPAFFALGGGLIPQAIRDFFPSFGLR